jgi:DNA-binding CsgD family transcriptional regulator
MPSVIQVPISVSPERRTLRRIRCARAQRHAARAPFGAALVALALASSAADAGWVGDAIDLMGTRVSVELWHDDEARGRELAALLPNARFVALSGDSHLPHVDDQRDVHRALAGFLDDAAPFDTNGDSPLTQREAEVLRLVAVGLSNREIASSLVLSEHTVHRHVANILRKLTQSSRAAAAAYATRVGYI